MRSIGDARCPPGALAPFLHRSREGRQYAKVPIGGAACVEWGWACGGSGSGHDRGVLVGRSVGRKRE